MSANIFWHEFRTRLRSILIWSLSMVFLLVFFFSVFSAFADQAVTLKDLLQRYPAELRAAFGLDNMDLSTVLGYYSFLFVFIQLCVAIQAAGYGFGLVSIEESELTADFLLSKPVSRSQVLVSKLLAALASLVVTDVIVGIASFVAILAFRGARAYQPGTLVLLLASLLLFQLCFLGVGLILSLLVKRVRSVTPYALGLGFGAYVLNGFSGVFGDVALELLTPFKHFDPAYIVKHAALNGSLALLNIAVTVVCLGASYWLYLRRDIPAVS